jgi:hypothetical protein
VGGGEHSLAIVIVIENQHKYTANPPYPGFSAFNRNLSLKKRELLVLLLFYVLLMVKLTAAKR